MEESGGEELDQRRMCGGGIVQKLQAGRATYADAKTSDDWPVCSGALVRTASTSPTITKALLFLNKYAKYLASQAHLERLIMHERLNLQKVIATEGGIHLSFNVHFMHLAHIYISLPRSAYG